MLLVDCFGIFHIFVPHKQYGNEGWAVALPHETNELGALLSLM